MTFLIWVSFQFKWHFSFGYISVLVWSGLTVSPALQPNKQPKKHAIIVSLQIFFVELLGIGKSGDRQFQLTSFSGLG